jgi:hypothetical protein
MRLIAPSDRPTRLATTGGGVRILTPGQEYDLEGEFLRMALAAGAVPATGESAPAPEPPKAAASDLDRAELIRQTIDELIDRGDDSAFTSNGQPRVREVAVILGDEVTKDEVEAVFATMR